MIKTLIRLLFKSDAEGVKPPPPVEEAPRDVIEPTEEWKRNIAGLDCSGEASITRQYVNYYREKEGLPLLGQGGGRGKGWISIYVWLYRMVEKYETFK